MKSTYDFKEMEANYLKNNMNTNMLIEYCVSNSTIRAFHKKNGYTRTYQPLSIFRTWALGFVSSKRFIENIQKMGDFEKLRVLAVNSLTRFWKKYDGGVPEFYHYNKLIDLFFKHLPLWNELKKKEKKWIFRNANAPLDRHSLLKLREDAPDLSIPSSVTMSYIDKSNYYIFQERIRELYGTDDALIFDLLAYNSRDNKEFRLIPH